MGTRTSRGLVKQPLPHQTEADKPIPRSDPRAIRRHLFTIVCSIDSMVLARRRHSHQHPQLADKDPDGKAFVKERVELAKEQPSSWQSYKFMNPVTKKVEPKQMYCERLDETAVCGGIYQ
jgi:hypothetical protein